MMSSSYLVYLLRLDLCKCCSKSECFALWRFMRPDYESLYRYHILYSVIVIIVILFRIIIEWKHAKVLAACRLSLNKKGKMLANQGLKCEKRIINNDDICSVPQ